MNKKNYYVSLSYLYIALPFIIFVLSWVKWYLSIPVTLFILYTIYQLIKKNSNLWLPTLNMDSIRLLFLILIIIAIWVYFSGIGGFVFQNEDHRWRNEIYQMLVLYDWPLIKDVTINNIIEARGMIYYIGFWLPSALIGKLFGIQAGYFFQILWAILGIFLVYYYICAHIKKMTIYPLFGLIFFSGLDIVGYYMLNSDLSGITNTTHIEFWNEIAQYSSMTTQLFWVFNQCIYAWLIICIILTQNDNRQIIFIWSLAMLTSTFPFVGMLPFLIYKIISNTPDSISFRQSFHYFFKDICTLENILGGGSIGIISFIYLIGNISAQNVDTPATSISSPGFVFLAFLFFLIEAGLYLLAMYPYQKANFLYYIVIIILLICPYIHVGSGVDFSMRASIPALFVMYLLFVETFSSSIKDHKWLITIALTLLFLVGSVTPIKEFCRTANQTYCMYKFDVSFPMDPVSEDEIIGADNFSGNIDNNIFFQYLAK